MQRTVLLTVLGAVLVAGCGSTDLGPLTSSPPSASLIGPAPTMYSGQATDIVVSVNLLVGTLTTRYGNAGPLPPTGGNVETSLATETLPGLLSAGVLTARATGADDHSQGVASTGHLLLTIPGDTISVGTLASQADAFCVNGAPLIHGSVTVGVLVINEQPTVITGNPNQVIPLPGGLGQIVVDEQIVTANSITVNAIHVTVAGLADVAIDQTHADIVCGATI